MSTTTPVQEHYDTSSVFVAVIGRPNVGKSSLTNLSGRREGGHCYLQTSDDPHPHHRRVTRGPLQYVLLDTPGVHKAHNKLGKRMDKTASDSIADVDVSMMLFEPYGALNEPEMALVEALRRSAARPLQSLIRLILLRSLLIWKPARLSSRSWVCLMPFTP